MRKLVLQSLGFVAICAIGAIVLGIIVSKNITEPEDTAKLAYPMKAASLSGEFASNEIRASEKWRGRRLKISGTISDFGTEILGRPYVLLGNVQLVFGRDSKSQLSRYSVGDEFAAVCDFEGKGLGLILLDCAE